MSKKYQVVQYFSWGSINFEPYEYFSILEKEEFDSWILIQEKTGKNIIVSKKAFINYSKLNYFKIEGP